ncbi:DUF4244 domain-containing protein [Herbidospora galbida]|uniref:DUF4244 domain-containing protein n=1 Tax=Herbidospora galbida TaxID=2575442 RepID=UPI0026CA7F92
MNVKTQGISWTRAAAPPPAASKRARAAGRLREAAARAARVLAERAGPARTDAGMSTAEYAVGTVAACGFAGLLFKVVTSPDVQQLLVSLVQKALALAG